MTAPTPTLPFTLPAGALVRNDAPDALVPNNEAIGRLALAPSLSLLRHLSLEHDIDLAAAASELAGASLSAEHPAGLRGCARAPRCGARRCAP